MLILDCPFYIIVVGLSRGKEQHIHEAVDWTEKRYTINIEIKF